MLSMMALLSARCSELSRRLPLLSLLMLLP
jgi:hypothetical protein